MVEVVEEDQEDTRMGKFSPSKNIRPYNQTPVTTACTVPKSLFSNRMQKDSPSRAFLTSSITRRTRFC